MAIIFDPILGKLRKKDDAIRLVTEDPATGQTGELIINTGTNQMKVRYNNSWQVLHTLDFAISYLLKEDGDKILTEAGDGLLLE
jgi:hypothetical protein